MFTDLGRLHTSQSICDLWSGLLAAGADTEMMLQKVDAGSLFCKEPLCTLRCALRMDPNMPVLQRCVHTGCYSRTVTAVLRTGISRVWLHC